MSTADFLVEIGTEELPPKALRQLRKAFEEGICQGLKLHSIPFEGPRGELASPRRLAVLITDVATQQPDQSIELLGPNVAAAFDKDGNPTGAALGFARKAGVDVAELQQIESPKGPRLAYISSKSGEMTADLLPEIVANALEALPIPKRMRWGDKRAEFVRPVHWILILLGDQILEANILELSSGNTTRGHRFHTDREIPVHRPEEYVSALYEQGKVQVDYLQRMDSIRESVNLLAKNTLNGNAVIGESLLEEVTALVEWPVALAGKFEERFLDVPSEALISSMREHQKYFHVVDDDGQLMPHFITVANIESQEPERVIDGNERVIRPRLADAAFFYETDKKQSFATFRERLKSIVFQAQLGSMFDKTERIAKLAEMIAPLVGANPSDAKKAGELCKCDLVSDMVQEFADLQGIMGRYYATASGENNEVSSAMFEQYLPRFAGDELPKTPTGIAVALADRLDTLTGIFGLGQQPTGSKDPFALRRASLGVLRILVEGNFSCSLRALIESSFDLHTGTTQDKDEVVSALLEYMLDRFSAWFADEQIAVENFLAVRSLNIDNAADIYARVVAVAEFSKSPEALSLAAANKRVANLLTKSDVNFDTEIKASLFEFPEETDLFDKLLAADKEVRPLLESRDYPAALNALSTLRESVDAFFDQVMVNAEDAAVRANRLALLNTLRLLFISIADISLLTTD